MNPIVLLIVIAAISLILAIKFMDKAHYWRRKYKSNMQKALAEQHELKAEIRALRISTRSA